MKQTKQTKKWTPELRKFKKQLSTVADIAKQVPNRLGLMAVNRAFYAKPVAGMVLAGQIGQTDVFVLVHAPEPTAKNAKPQRAR